MNTKAAVVLVALLSLLLVDPCLVHPAMANVSSAPSARIEKVGKIPIGIKDPTCTQVAHDSCTRTKKCCTCKVPEYNTCYVCCLL
ncbi:hypothetical protein LINGRAHAP2_LOCUS33634 [Linum grandiflorum]